MHDLTSIVHGQTRIGKRTALVDGVGGNSGGCLKWGGGGNRVIKESFLKILEKGGG